MRPKPVEGRRTAAIFRAGNRQAAFPALSILISASFVIKAHRRCFFHAKRNADRSGKKKFRFRQSEIFGSFFFSMGICHAGLFGPAAGALRLFFPVALRALVRHSFALCGGAASGAEPSARSVFPAGPGAVADPAAALGRGKRPLAICGAVLSMVVAEALPSPARH